jgi:beta-1,4-N-acetylglucosaminyltransferase
MWPYVFFVGIVGAILRLYSIIPNRNRRKQPRNGRPIKTLVVLGSGGHTTEMCAMVQSLQQNPIYRFEYVVAETDDKSPTFAQLKLAKVQKIK